MRHQFLFLLLCWSPLLGMASVQDSLELLLSRHEPLTKAKVDLLNSTAKDLIYINPLKSAEFSYKALHQSQQINYVNGQAEALRGISNGLLAEDQFFLALKNLQKSIRLFEDIKDSTGIVDCYTSMGLVYRQLHNQERELYFNQLAYDYFQQQKNIERTAFALYNLGETYFNLGNLEKAMELTQSAIVLNDSLKKYSTLSSCFKTMGNIWVKKNNFDKAEEYFHKVLNLSSQLGASSQKLGTVDALLNLGKIAYKDKRRTLAIRALEKAAELVRKYRLYAYLTPVHEELIRQYTEQKNLPKLHETIQEYSKTTDQLNQSRREVMSHFTQIFLNADSLEHFNSELKEKTELQGKQIAERSSRNTITGILLLALLVIAIFLTVGLVKLRRNNKSLTAQRTLIQAQNSELEELNTVKDKFLSILSHDIKAPLIGLNNYADLLTSEKLPADSKQLVLFGKELKDQLESTSAMADQLITWVQLQMKSFNTQPTLIDLTLALTEVYKLFEPLVEQKKITLEHKGSGQVYVWADRNQLDFMLRNLVNNAIKYSFSGGVVTITIGSLGDEAIVRIVDQGIGMSHQTMKSVSGIKHFQSISGTAGEEGTGLGLRICREFAALNHGKIEVVSTEGKGSVFTLSLPCQSQVS